MVKILMRGQVSIEFLFIFSALLMVFAGISMSTYQRGRGDLEEVLGLMEARGAATTLVNALNSVYCDGPGARQTVYYCVPEGASILLYPKENVWVLAVVLGSENVELPTLLNKKLPISGGWVSGRRHRTSFRFENVGNGILISDNVLP
ncbi:MAG: hypothetical protein QXG14_01685 [Candidatus Hadarchaeales archaeon]